MIPTKLTFSNLKYGGAPKQNWGKVKWCSGGSSLGTEPQKTEIEEKLYDMIYKQYVKGKGKFSKHNSLGAQIGQDVKNCDENREKKWWR